MFGVFGVRLLCVRKLVCELYIVFFFRFKLQTYNMIRSQSPSGGTIYTLPTQYHFKMSQITNTAMFLFHNMETC